ncbi:MAG: DNA translocase FtsK 4TM domain-containing protein [Thermoanaerobacteraceae bacterium]
MKTKEDFGQNNKSFKDEILGIIFLAFSLISLLSLYTNSTGVIGKNLAIFLRGFFGIGSYIISLLIFVFALMFLFKKNEFIKTTKTISLLFLFICIISLDHISYYSIADNFKAYILNGYKSGLNNLGGGAIAAFLLFFLIKLLGVTGSYIFLIAASIIFGIIITDTSITSIITKIHRLTSSFFLKHIKQKKGNKTEEIISEDKGLNNRNFQEKLPKENDFDILDVFDEDKVIKDKESGKIKSNDELSSDDKKDSSLKILSDNSKDEYVFPPITLLNEAKPQHKINNDIIINKAKKLENTLLNFGIEAKVVQVTKGPAITRFELQPNPGIKVSRIVSLTDDIALSLAAPSVRIEAPIPGKSVVGIEVPNDKISAVSIREVIDNKKFKYFKSNLSIALGKDIAGNIIIADLSKMPHLLIAGATGSGKSVCINTLIISLLYKSSPSEVKMILIDPKVVELNIYNGIPHLLTPVVTDPRKAAGVLNWAVQEMTNRYNLFAEHGVRDIEGYNQQADNKLYKLVIIIDELSDLMMVSPADVEEHIIRLAQMARAAGIHLVIATQRPSVDVITGVIKANIPSRISFAVSSQTDSRTILDMAGAEKLLGKGDMLFNPIGASKPLRIQGAFISDKEVEEVVSFLKNNFDPQYNEIYIQIKSENKDLGEEDELLKEAVEIILETGQASISMIQRRLRVGYARAARIIDQIEQKGIISGYDGSKPRQIIMDSDEIKKLFDI